jgi:glycosyltransferase involved in cell wall biosynthesis
LKILIISHTPHYYRAGQLVGWGPTIREIDQLASMFDQVIHLAVLYAGDAPESCLAYQAPNIQFLPVRPTGGDHLAGKLSVLTATPGYLAQIQKAITALDDQDVIHVRCPANLSLIALLLLSLRHVPSRRWIKYAGNWRPNKLEPLTYKLQRILLQKNTPRCVVTVNGSWSGQPAHVLSFYNPSYSVAEIENAKNRQKELYPPYRLIFVGALDRSKGCRQAVETAVNLLLDGINLALDVIGDGKLRVDLEAYVRAAGQSEKIRFHGWLPRQGIEPFYEKAHFILLPSRSEGWPKVLSEAMAYGVVPLAGAVSSIPQTLSQFGVGQALPPDEPAGFVQAIQEYIHQPELWKAESMNGIQAALHFTYEAYLNAVRLMMKAAWAIDFPALK